MTQEQAQRLIEILERLTKAIEHIEKSIAEEWNEPY